MTLNKKINTFRITVDRLVKSLHLQKEVKSALIINIVTQELSQEIWKYTFIGKKDDYLCESDKWNGIYEDDDGSRWYWWWITIRTNS